jgi:hypothetical protein
MKTSSSKWLGYLCRARFFIAVVVGLGIGWAMSKSLGVAVGFAIGGATTLIMLARPRGE